MRCARRASTVCWNRHSSQPGKNSRLQLGRETTLGLRGLMNDTMRKYRDYVMTGFVKQVVPVVVEKASGAVVTDIDGREYLDCFAGISVVNAGHCNPDVIAAAKAQMDKLIHCSSYIYHV